MSRYVNPIAPRKAIEDIRDLINALWNDMARTDIESPLMDSFVRHASAHPITPANIEDLKSRSTFTMSAIFDKAGTNSVGTDEQIYLHGFRDSLSKIVSGLNFRIRDLNQNMYPSPRADKVLAQACFYLEILPPAYRQIFNMCEDTGSPDYVDTEFAKFLAKIETETLPIVYQLLPQALKETGYTLEDFERNRDELIRHFPHAIQGIEAIGPVEKMLAAPSLSVA